MRHRILHDRVCQTRSLVAAERTSDLGGCQNYGPLLGTLNIRGHIIIGTQKGTIILTTTHLRFSVGGQPPCNSGMIGNIKGPKLIAIFPCSHC